MVGPAGRGASNQRRGAEPQYQPMPTYEALDTQQACIADQQAQLLAHIRSEAAQSEAP